MNNSQFVGFCLQALAMPTVYMWGTYGKPITTGLCNQKFAQYPKNYSSKRRTYLLSLCVNHPELKTCDCCGLIKWALWTNGDIKKAPKWNEATDRNCSGLLSAAKEKGKISTMPDELGIVVYKYGHVGVYIGNGQVIECTLGSRGDGVVKSELKAVAWTHWLKVPEITYIGNVPQKTLPYQRKLSLVERLKLLLK